MRAPRVSALGAIASRVFALGALASRVSALRALTPRALTSRALAPRTPVPHPAAGHVFASFLVPALVGLALGVLALWPALGSGFVLRYDMVFVPDPPIPARSGGFPRAVPSDLVVALLSSVLPGQIAQKAILLGIFVLAATGAAALVPGERRIARLVAAVFYAWNVYLAQRLLLGQWALLLGYAGLPWAVRAVTRGGMRRTVLALIPAAIGGFQAMLVSAMAVVPVAGRRAPRALLAVAVLSLPWLVPALGSSAVTDPAGVRAFAPRADGPLGTLGSLLTLGGVWNSGAAVPGQETWWSALVRLAVAVAAVTGYALLARGWPSAGHVAGGGPVAKSGRGTAGGGRDSGRPAYWGGLTVASVAGLTVACAGAFLPGAVEALVGLWPGFGPLRDGQLYLAPFALLQAVGLAAVTARLSPVIRPGMLVLPLLVLPTFALGAFGRLVAVDYHPDWSGVRSVVDADPVPGALLTLPWGAYRVFGWNGGRVVLDPAVKSFRREVVWNDGLPVGLGDGRTLVLAGEDPRARRVGAILAGSGPLTGPLAAEGISHVLVQRSSENLFRSRLPGARLIFAGQELVLYRL
ncbi:hypothetical protein ABT352_21005 [Streptosporangium sp. NPDC000563]|uniref:hypothetical protein n=1 Tax=unclassified Streptosporangium TaxID=2632669 RepID=UPI0033263402